MSLELLTTSDLDALFNGLRGLGWREDLAHARVEIVRERLDLFAKALGSCVWVLNNRHNKDEPEWDALAAAALRDVERVGPQ